MCACVAVCMRWARDVTQVKRKEEVSCLEKKIFGCYQDMKLTSQCEENETQLETKCLWILFEVLKGELFTFSFPRVNQ